MLGFLLEGADFHILIELDHAVTLGIADVIPEDGRALFLLPGADEEIFKAVAEEDVVPKDKAGVASLDEVSGEKERLGDASGFGCVMYSKEHPHWLPSPRSLRNCQPSSGVVMMATSRMPARRRTDNG